MTNERLAVSAADLDDLDVPALEAFIARRVPALLATMSRDDAGIRLGLLAKVAPRTVPTLAGLYLFGRVPQVFFPEWGVTCISSAGSALLDPIEERADLDGGFGALIEGALSFLRARVADAGDASEFPLEVAREAIVNALCHRDLRKPSRVVVRRFRDRLEIVSPGGPPEGLTDLEELGREGGTSHPRNPIVASVGRALGYGEQLGRGLALITQRGGASVAERAEVRATPREVMVVLPARWQRPPNSH